MTHQDESQKQEDIDFEIRFYEGILEERPYFLQILIVLGELYTRKGSYEKGLEIDKRLAQLKPDDPVILYNLACSYSLVGDIEKAFVTIKKAIEYGYDDFDHLVKDDDLVNLRQDNRFQEFFAKIKNKKNHVQ